ncbi:MAG TPA: AAA family ATPase [Armatimonadota bacterium]|nr:AAA family ATPase [Armatimonadota bacterium]HPU00221.1 AAA family ATPase [Armatimonadota bacterium]
MIRTLLTGISGTGKSTVIRELAARGHKAVDLDSDEWSKWVPFVPFPGVKEVPGDPEQEWVWREDRVQALLSTEDAEMLFVSGCASNMRQFLDQFDHIILLSAPADLIVERLITRTNNPYGKDPEERARVLGHLESVEPLLRRRAGHEINTQLPLGQVVEEVLRIARSRPREARSCAHRAAG